MSDIKTMLRELSVIVGLYKIINSEELSYNSKDIYHTLLECLNNDSLDQIIKVNNIVIDPANKAIIKNGYILSRALIDRFSIKSIKNIEWLGFKNNREKPIDLIINDLEFSLKENSFILENMGLYKLINLLTGEKNNRVHLFKVFSEVEFLEYFEYTWDLLVKYLLNNDSWKYEDLKGKYASSIILVNNNVKMTYESKTHKQTVFLPLKCDLYDYEKNTSSILREKVFSKWINSNAVRDNGYLNKKKICSIRATENLSRHLKNNLKPDEGLYRMLGMYDKPYIYAKVLNEEVSLFRVPSFDEIDDVLIIESITPLVPKTQANLLINVLNKTNNCTITLRSEIRFSHGQFNGIPEAKLYFQSDSSLEVIYSEV